MKRKNTHSDFSNKIREECEKKGIAYTRVGTSIKGNIGKKTGFVSLGTPGAYDSVLAVNGISHWVELKVEGDSLRESQEDWSENMYLKGGINTYVLKRILDIHGYKYFLSSYYYKEEYTTRSLSQAIDCLIGQDISYRNKNAR